MVQNIPLDPKAVHRALSDDATFATVLHAVALISYGPEIYEWEPLALYLELEKDYGVTLTEDNESKLQAIMLATQTDLFYEDPEGFRGICNTLASGDPGLDGLDELTLAEALWGMYEVELQRDPAPMQPGVEKMLQSTILAEAKDLETDPLEDPAGYLIDYVEERRQQLQKQLTELGIPAMELPPAGNALI